MNSDLCNKLPARFDCDFAYFDLMIFKITRAGFQVVVISGASSVLGEAISRRFYSAGCKVILMGPNELELERIRSHLISLRPKQVPVYQPECVPLDLSNTSRVSETVAGVLEQCGQIDVLVNNANISTRAEVLSTPHDTDTRVMNINYFGPVALTKGNGRELSFGD